MFYELIGRLLAQASVALASDEVGVAVDERAQRERRQITALLRRVAAIWPELFSALHEECRILEKTAGDVAEAAAAHGLSPAKPRSAPEVAEPLLRYRELQCELDEWVILLRTHDGQAWAQEALRTLREGLGDAAEVQGRLVDQMLAA